MSMVLDSSAVLAWIYADEITEPIRHVFNLVSQDGAWAPGPWKLEVANILEMDVRRGRQDAAYPELLPRRGLPLAFKEHAQNGPAPAPRRPRVPSRLVPRLRGLCASVDAEPRGAAQAEGVAVL